MMVVQNAVTVAVSPMAWYLRKTACRGWLALCGSLLAASSSSFTLIALAYAVDVYDDDEIFYWTLVFSPC